MTRPAVLNRVHLGWKIGVGYRGTGGARRVTVGLVIHLLSKFTTILVVVIAPFERIDNLAALLTDVLITAIIVHRSCARLRIPPLPGVDDDVSANKAYEQVFVD